MVKIEVVKDVNTSTRSKYAIIWHKLFSDSDLEQLKQAINQIKNDPLGIVKIDISEIKQVTQRERKINERCYISDEGEIQKSPCPIARSFAKFLLENGIKGVKINIKELENGNLYLYIRKYTPHQRKSKSSASS